MLFHIYNHVVDCRVNDAMQDDFGDFNYNDGSGMMANQIHVQDLMKNFCSESIKKGTADCANSWVVFTCNSDTLFNIRQMVALLFHPQIFFENEGWEDFLRRPNVSQ